MSLKDDHLDAVERYEEFKDRNFDDIIMRIASGKIRVGKYAHLVKVKKNEKIKGKVLFRNGKREEYKS